LHKYILKPTYSFSLLNKVEWEYIRFFIKDIAGEIKMDKNSLVNSLNPEEVQELYVDLVETSQDLIWQTDAEGRLIYLNPAWAETFGYSIEEMIDHPFTDFQSPEIAKRDLKEFFRILKEGMVRGYETLYLSKSGDEIYLSFNAKAVYNKKGAIVGARGTAYDITESKLAGEKLEEGNRFINSMVNLSPDILYIYDLNEQKNIYSNDGIQLILGYSTDEILAMGSEIIPKLMHPDDFKSYIETIFPQYNRASDNDRISNIYRMRDKDGEWRFLESIEIVYSRNADGTPKQIFGVAHDITDIKLAEQRIGETNERHAAMLANSGDVIGIMGTDGIMTYKSPNIEQLFGWEPEELVGKEGWYTVHPEDLEQMQEEFKKVLEKENAQITVEYRYLCKDGTYSWIELTAINCVNNPTINGVLLNYHDISDRKKAEEALRQSEVKYKSLFQNLDSSTSMYDVVWDDEGKPCDYRIVAVNPMYEKTVGVKASDVVGKTLLEVFPQTEPAWMEIMHSTVTTGVTFSLENYSVEIDKWVEITVFVPEKGLLAMIGTDVTDRKKAELALAEEKERLAVTLRSIGDGVITTDTDGSITLLNKAVEEMTGWNSEGAIGQPLFEVFSITDEHTRKQFNQLVEEVIETGAVISLSDDTSLTTKDGREIIISNQGSPLLNKNGEVSGVVLVFRDITDERNAQEERVKLTEQLHQSQKMDAIGQLAGGIAHDFNNALGGIIGAVDLLQCGDLDKTEANEYLDMITTASERAGDLTKKLLLFSRKEKKVSTTIDMSKIVSDTVKLLGHVINKNITITIDDNATLKQIIGDDSLLQNVIMNLAINASYAMSEGGSLIFTLKNQILDAEYCSTSPFEIESGNYVSISVRDTGCGMTPEVQSHIFEPFYTTKVQGKGTGLGLATVYGTMQDHLGAITVYSEPGAGTIFHLYFPITELVQSTIEEVKAITGSGTVLVIDDEELIRATASAQLRSLGYKVISAENGQIGLDKFKSKSNEIDLVLLDMIMPVMGGRETLEKLREIDSTIPVIISSGFSKEEDTNAMKEKGISGFLHKPFRRVELAEAVGTILGDS
jgi:PAS domain S-box-containing protein